MRKKEPETSPVQFVHSDGTIKNYPEGLTPQKKLNVYLEMKERIEKETKRRRDQAEYKDLEVEFINGSTRIYPMITGMERQEDILVLECILYKEEPTPWVGPNTNRLGVVFPRRVIASINLANVRSWKWI